MTKVSSLVELLGAGVDKASDLLEIIDMSETGAARNKKIKVAQLLGLITDIAGLLDFQGSQDCSANPNYPAASQGDAYLVSVAGKIGGASGITVEVGDWFIAIADNAGGTQASVGTSWSVTQGNVISTSGGVDVEDEGTPETSGATTLNFVGSGVTAADVGGGVVDITIPGATSGIDVEDEGVSEATGALTLNFTGAGVSANDVGGGQVDITIPGSSGSYEGGPPATVPTVASLTWVNQGSATATDGTRGILVANDVDGEVHILNTTTPSTPYNIYMRVEAFQLSSSANTTGMFDDMGIVLRDNTNGDFIFVHFRNQRISGDEQNVYGISIDRWTNATTFSTTALERLMLRPLKWLRVNNDGTTLTVYVSENGLDWISMGTETIATFVGTVDRYGVGFRSSTTTATSALVSYFSTTAPS